MAVERGGKRTAALKPPGSHERSGRMHIFREVSTVKTVLVALLFVASPAFAQDTVAAEYDRFRNNTVVTAETELQNGLKLRVLYVSDGQTTTRPGSIGLTLISDSRDWEYLRCHHLNFLVDGKPFPVGEVDHDGTVGRGYVLEYINIEMPVARFTQLARASRVEGRICNTEFSLREEQLQLLRDLANRTKGIITPPRPTPARLAAAASGSSGVDLTGNQTFFSFQVEREAIPVDSTTQVPYPEALRASSVEGEVDAQFVVDTLGLVEVRSFKVLRSTHDLFSAAVRAHLPRMRFAPADNGSRPVRQLVQQKFIFNVTP